jgi:hypothetical protein
MRPAYKTGGVERCYDGGADTLQQQMLTNHIQRAKKITNIL